MINSVDLTRTELRRPLELIQETVYLWLVAYVHSQSRHLFNVWFTAVEHELNPRMNVLRIHIEAKMGVGHLDKGQQMRSDATHYIMTGIGDDVLQTLIQNHLITTLTRMPDIRDVLTNPSHMIEAITVHYHHNEYGQQPISRSNDNILSMITKHRHESQS